MKCHKLRPIRSNYFALGWKSRICWLHQYVYRERSIHGKCCCISITVTVLESCSSFTKCIMQLYTNMFTSIIWHSHKFLPLNRFKCDFSWPMSDLIVPRFCKWWLEVFLGLCIPHEQLVFYKENDVDNISSFSFTKTYICWALSIQISEIFFRDVYGPIHW